MAFATVQSWSETPASNTEIDGVNIDEGCNPSGINNAIRELMAQVAAWTGDDTIASGATTDLSTVNGQYVTISGTTTITGFGTVKAGWEKFLKFDGALTLTHNATSLILPGAANITTAAGDTAVFVSLGSGNWRCIAFQRASGLYTSAGSANTWTQTQTFDTSGQAIILQSPTSNAGPAYMRFRDDDGDNIGYVGMGGSGNDTISLARNVAGTLEIDAGSGGTITFTGTPSFGTAVPVASGGTGATTAAAARSNLGVTAANITQTANAVGTYGFLCNDETGVGSHGPGGTLAGSSLLFAGLHIDNTAESVTMETSSTVFPSGTWQCMGRMINTGAANEKSATLWVRTV